ncbi:S24/S26 family peptidase [Mannheimia haemolytica]
MKEKWNDIVKRRIKELGIHRTVFAERVNSSSSGLGSWLNETRVPNLDQIAKMLYLVGIDSVTLHTSECLMSVKDSYKINKIEGVPVKGSLAFGFPEMGNAVEKATLKTAEQKQFIDFRASSPRSEAYQILGTALSPRIRRNEFVVIDPNKKPLETDEVLVYFKETEEYAIKRLVELAKKEGDPVFLADLNQDMLRMAVEEDAITMYRIEGLAKESKVIR